MKVLSPIAIRPESTSSSADKDKAIANDIAWLKERRDDFINVPCPACDSNQSSQTLEKDGFTFKICTSCRTIYMPERPTSKLLSDFYVQSEVIDWFAKYIFPASREIRIDHIYKPRLQHLTNICKKNSQLGGRYVEIGAGSGIFAHLVKESNAFSKTFVVEPAKSMASACRALNLDVLETTAEQLSDELQFDVVTSFEVLEHLSSPKDFMRHIHRLLSPNGLCILTTPNAISLDVLELGAASTTIGFTHLTLFNPESITYMLKQCGFKTLEVLTPGVLDVGLLQEAWSKDTHIPSQFLKYIACDAPAHVVANFQKFICENLLSSHMWVVARKI